MRTEIKAIGGAMSDTGPDDLKRLGARLDEVQRKRARGARPAPSQVSIAYRFGAEMFAGVVGGGAIGWGLDWLFGRFGYPTKPWLMIVFVVLGTAAGIRNVMHAAKEINEQMAAQGSVPAVKSDEED